MKNIETPDDAPTDCNTIPIIAPKKRRLEFPVQEENDVAVEDEEQLVFSAELARTLARQQMKQSKDETTPLV